MHHHPAAAHLAQNWDPLQTHMPVLHSDASSDLRQRALGHYLGQETHFPVLHAESRHRFLEGMRHGRAEGDQAVALPWCFCPYSVMIYVLTMSCYEGFVSSLVQDNLLLCGRLALRLRIDGLEA